MLLSVDERFPLSFYFRIAHQIVKQVANLPILFFCSFVVVCWIYCLVSWIQAKVYREEGNLCDLYFTLVQYSRWNLIRGAVDWYELERHNIVDVYGCCLWCMIFWDIYFTCVQYLRLNLIRGIINLYQLEHHFIMNVYDYSLFSSIQGQIERKNWLACSRKLDLFMNVYCCSLIDV